MNKIILLKEKIENEINKINETYDKINNKLKSIYREKNEILNKNYNIKIEELAKQYEENCKKIKIEYEENCEKLLKEEYDLKDKLDNEVTKAKEKLENYLSKTNELIRQNEKLNKGIKIINKKENEKNIIQNLSYISAINKNKKEMKSLNKTMMQSFRISFDEEAKELKFDEYFFNGFPRPYNIEFRYDEFINIDWRLKENWSNHSKIKYKVEMKNYIDKYESIFEGNEMHLKVDYDISQIYKEFRICALFNNLICSLSKTINIKDKISNILSDLDGSSKYVKLILEWTGYKYLQLLYSGNKDGSSSKIFHEKCDGKGPTITLYKNEKGNIFGAYSSISWSSDKGIINDSKSFIFTLTNIYNISPKILEKMLCTEHDLNKGPSFFNESIFSLKKFSIIDISKDFKKLCFSNYRGENGHSIFTGNKSQNFKIIEIEVFKIFN